MRVSLCVSEMRSTRIIQYPRYPPFYWWNVPSTPLSHCHCHCIFIHEFTIADQKHKGSVTTREGAEIHQNDSIGTLKHINCWDDEERWRRASSGSHWLCNLLLLQLLMVLLIIIPLYDTFYNFTPLSSILEAIYTDTSDSADNAL